MTSWLSAGELAAVLSSFLGTGVEACRCLSQRLSTRKTVIPTK